MTERERRHPEGARQRARRARSVAEEFSATRRMVHNVLEYHAVRGTYKEKARDAPRPSAA